MGFEHDHPLLPRESQESPAPASRLNSSATGLPREQEVSQVTTQPPYTPRPAASRSTEDALLADAGRIFDQLRIRLAELDHREQTLHEVSADLDQRQMQFSRWVEQTRQDLTDREQQLSEQEQQAQEQLAQFEQHQSQMQTERAQLETEQQRLRERQAQQDAEFRRTEIELEQLRRTRLEEVERVEQESAEILANKRREFEEFCQTQLEEIQQQQAQATRRLKLQEDHLERLKHQVEQQRSTLQRETQQARQSVQQKSEQVRLRAAQLQHARALLDQRAETFRREEQVVRDSLTQEQAQWRHRLEEFEQQQQEWQQLFASQQQEQEIVRAQLDRQEQTVQLQLERFQEMRQQIQREHAETLELRLALEELKIQHAIDKGQTPDLDSLNSLRDQLAEHLVGTREQIETLQQELSETSQDLQRRMAEYKRYETDSRKWISTGIATWEEQRQLLQLERDQLSQQREEWESLQYKQVVERREAEQIIQSLLEQLEAAQPTAAPRPAEAA